MGWKCLNSSGGVFTAEANGKEYYLVRDKDIVPWWLGPDDIGFMGSDTYTELTDDNKARTVYSEIATTGLRFALAAMPERAEIVRAKMRRGNTLNIATSNPKCSKECSGAAGCAIRIVAEPAGSVEAMPRRRSELDGIIDIVETGNTQRQNGLEIVADNLLPITIGAVWQTETETRSQPADETLDVEGLLRALAVIARRVEESETGLRNSYTQRLAGNSEKLIAKIEEETKELIEAYTDGTPDQVADESADQLYPTVITNNKRGTSFIAVLNRFAARNLQ